MGGWRRKESRVIKNEGINIWKKEVEIKESCGWGKDNTDGQNDRYPELTISL